MSIKDQPPPKQNKRPAVWPLVIKDMKERDGVGRSRYGTPLQPFNGRDALVDAYQEALDLAVYLRQAIYERDAAVEFSTAQSRCLEVAADLMATNGIDVHYIAAVRKAAEMARIGKATIKDGKVRPVDKANASQKIARKAKADRIEKGLRANRERAKK